MQYIIILALALFTTACNITVPVETAAEVIVVSTEVDKVQSELGQYADSDVMAELDALQEDITTLLKSGQGALDINDYYDRAVALYLVISEEVAARSDEMDDSQKAMLLELDAMLVDLNDKIVLLKESNPTGTMVLEALGDVATILKFYAVL